MEALEVLEAFRAALIEGDDATAWSLLFPAHASRNGFARAGLSHRYLAALGVSPAELARNVPSLTARVITSDDDPDALIAFGWVDPPTATLSSVGVIDGPTPATVLALISTDEGWRIWGQPTSEEFRAARFVPIPPPAVGPIQ